MTHPSTPTQRTTTPESAHRAHTISFGVGFALTFTALLVILIAVSTIGYLIH